MANLNSPNEKDLGGVNTTAIMGLVGAFAGGVAAAGGAGNFYIAFGAAVISAACLGVVGYRLFSSRRNEES